MPVVINDFEVVADPQPERRAAASDSPGAAPPPDKAIEPRALVTVLRTVEQHALRTWAH